MKTVKTGSVAGAVLVTTAMLASPDMATAASVPVQALPTEAGEVVADMYEAAASETITLHVKGMTCGGCVLAVRRVLNRMDGVAEADVSLEEQRAVVTFDPEKVSVDAMIQAIEEVGFEATRVGDPTNR